MEDSTGGKFLGRLFPALARRDFRIFWFGQSVSMIGTWMQNVGQAWLVLELTGSAAKLATVSATQFLPMMLLSVFAGPVIDRFPKRRVLLLTQSTLAVLALALAFIAGTGIARYWMILVLAFLLGIVNLLDNPTRQAYVIELAGRDVLMNAVSLNSASFNLARILGPGIAGLLIEAIGIAPCFLLNSLSFVAVIAALTTVRARGTGKEEGIKSVGEVLGSVGEGLSYIAARPRILLPLVLMAVLSTLIINYNIFIPTFAKITLGRGAAGYGFLLTSLGIGSLAAALGQAVRSGSPPGRLRIFVGAIGMCGAIVAASFQRDYAFAAVFLAVLGFFTILLSTSMNTTIQLASEDSYRGRVMSIWSLVFGGVTPIGSLWAGAMTENFGPATAMAASGALGFVFTVGLILSLLARSPSVPPGTAAPESPRDASGGKAS